MSAKSTKSSANKSSVSDTPVRAEKSEKSKKSKSKRIGVKSVLAHNGNLVMTTFGKGNNAVLVLNKRNIPQEKDLEEANANEKANYKISGVDQKQIVLAAKRRFFSRDEIKAVVPNPVRSVRENLSEDSPIGSDVLESAQGGYDDYLGLKGELEREYFGREFPEDNIRIQIIHNLQSIQKIFGIYMANICYTVNNLQDEENHMGEDGDILGPGLGNRRSEDLLKRMKPFLGMFGDVFEPADSKEFYDKNKVILETLNTIRQITAHADPANKIFVDYDRKYKDIITNKKSDNKSNREKSPNKEERLVLLLSENYKKRIDRINSDFIKNSRVNLSILFENPKIFGLNTLDEAAKTKIAEMFYKFCVRKDAKNLGVNMTKIRELVLEKHNEDIRAKIDNDFRQKFCVLADFVIYYRLVFEDDKRNINEWVEDLRGTKDEAEKDRRYEEFAELAYKLTKKRISPLLKKFSDEEELKKLRALISSTKDKKQKGESERWNREMDARLQKVLYKPDDAVFLVKMLSFLCNFLEGKEINELLTAYIHCFENVQSFLDILKELNENVKFDDKYSLLNKKENICKVIADQLRFSASIGKMKGDLSSAKRPLYVAALKMLGAPEDNVSEQWLDENLLLGKEAKKNPEKVDKVNPLRNFIARNVVSSKRFLYLVRFSNAATVRAVMANEKIVRYVLDRLPDNQIVSYARIVSQASQSGFAFKEGTPERDSELKTIRDMLSRKLKGFSFNSILGKSGEMTERKHNPGGKYPELESLKAITGLYLAVAYVVIKNLVKINARYFIAFAAYERDHSLIKKKDENGVLAARAKCRLNYYPVKDKQGNVIQVQSDRYDLIQYFLEKDRAIVRAFRQSNGKASKKGCHFTKKYYDILKGELRDSLALGTGRTGKLATEVRNHTEHLKVLGRLADYVADFRKNQGAMRSYFELYHYVLQRMLSEDEDLNPKDSGGAKWWNDSLYRGLHNKALTHLMYVNLAYCLPRYKNLTTPALFDPDSEDAKEGEGERE